jgi:hypothetical protein
VLSTVQYRKESSAMSVLKHSAGNCQAERGKRRGEEFNATGWGLEGVGFVLSIPMSPVVKFQVMPPPSQCEGRGEERRSGWMRRRREGEGKGRDRMVRWIVHQIT